MKRTHRRIVLIVCCALCLIAGLAALSLRGTRPFRSLDAAQVTRSTVELLPPDELVEVEDIPALVAMLQELVIYREDNGYTEYSGQAVVVTLTMADGTQRIITGYNPFVVIDGTGYRTSYEPCEALNRYANELLHQQGQ